MLLLTAAKQLRTGIKGSWAATMADVERPIEKKDEPGVFVKGDIGDFCCAKYLIGNPCQIPMTNSGGDPVGDDELSIGVDALEIELCVADGSVTDDVIQLVIDTFPKPFVPKVEEK